MNACAFCRSVITRDYFRVGPLLACPPCVEKERAIEIATRRRYLYRGLAFATITAGVVSLGLWGVNELCSMGDSGLFSAGAFLRGTAVMFAGYVIGTAAIRGAKLRGSFALQMGAGVLTYLAWAMSLVWFVLERIPSSQLSVTRILYLVLMGPLLPWLSLTKHPIGITGIIVVSIASLAAVGAAEKKNLVSGPFRLGESEKPMFQNIGR